MPKGSPTTSALGRSIRDDLGGVESVSTVLGLARGTLTPGAGQEEIAGLLRLAHRLRAECLEWSDVVADVLM